MLDRVVRCIIRLCTPRGRLDDTPADPLADEDYPLSPLTEGHFIMSYIL